MLPSPDDQLSKAAPLSGPPVPNMGGIPTPSTRPPRPPAVMGPSEGTNGRPRTSSDSLTVGQNPNSPYRLPGPPPAPVEAPGAPAPAPAPQPAPAPAPAQPGQPQTAAPAVPMKPQMAIRSTQDLPAGVEVDTQLGTAYKDPTSGQVATKLNATGKAAFQRSQAGQLQRFGSYYGSDDPNHPRPPIESGLPLFNPDTGKWIE